MLIVCMFTIIILVLLFCMQGIQLYVEVRDRDSESTSQLIGFNRFSIIQPLNEPSGNMTISVGFVTINVIITVFCAQTFQGSDCTQCIPGFTGPMCDENIDDCLGETCSGNGQCVDGLNTFTCNCDSGLLTVSLTSP